ncbi:hypothetical protein LY76DRAFT_364639 [Colletotrichum caudatum]|nr:hypothetical protein LY76DRAFT_364639 [Colletotrichum caudatum]
MEHICRSQTLALAQRRPLTETIYQVPIAGRYVYSNPRPTHSPSRRHTHTHTQDLCSLPFPLTWTLCSARPSSECAFLEHLNPELRFLALTNTLLLFQNNLEDASGIRLDGLTANGLRGYFQSLLCSFTLAHAQAKGSRPAQRPT